MAPRAAVTYRGPRSVSHTTISAESRHGILLGNSVGSLRGILEEIPGYLASYFIVSGGKVSQATTVGRKWRNSGESRVIDELGLHVVAPDY